MYNNINNLKNLIIYTSVMLFNFWYISLFFLLPLPCEIIIKLGVVVVGPGALKPSDGDGIESRRPLLLSLLCLLFFHFLIFAPILVCV